MEPEKLQNTGEAVGRALDGLRVVEAVRSIAGQYCTKLLADMGAEVIKVEPPEGDETRNRGPFPKDVPDSERSGLYIWLNNNKLGITLRVEQATGRDILLDLLQRADVFVEDFNQERPKSSAWITLSWRR